MSDFQYYLSKSLGSLVSETRILVLHHLAFCSTNPAGRFSRHGSFLETRIQAHGWMVFWWAYTFEISNVSVKAHGWYPFEFIKVKDTDLKSPTRVGPELWARTTHSHTSLDIPRGFEWYCCITRVTHTNLNRCHLRKSSTGIPQLREIRQSLFL